jgi:hypothetical protein
VKYFATTLLTLGLLSLALGLASCRGLPADTSTDRAAISASQRSVRAIFLGATASALGFYLLRRTPGPGSVSQLRADFAMLHARVCRKCGRAYNPVNCVRRPAFGLVPVLCCPECGSSLERSGALVTAIGIAMLSASFFLPLLYLAIPHLPDFLIAAAMISQFSGFPILIVGFARLCRQPKRSERYE